MVEEGKLDLRWGIALTRDFFYAFEDFSRFFRFVGERQLGVAIAILGRGV